MAIRQILIKLNLPKLGHPERLGPWLLMLWVVLLPFQVATASGMRLAPADLVLAVCLLLTARWLKFPRHAWSAWHLALPPLFAMGLLVAVLRTGQITTYALWQKGCGLLVLLGGYALVTGLTTDWARIRALLRVFLMSVVATNLLAMAVFLVALNRGMSLPWFIVDPRRLAGFLLDPNAYGGLLVTALAVHLPTRYSSRPLLGGIWGTLATLTLGLGLLLTLSRSAWIGALVLLALIGMARPGLFRALLVPGAVALVGVPVLVGLNRFSGLVAVASRLPQIAARLDIGAEATGAFARSPLTGIGLGVFPLIAQKGYIVHNTLLWSLTEMGFVGLVIFVGFLAWFVLAGLRAYASAPGDERILVGSLVVAHLAMVALSMGIEAFYQRHWWLIMALLGSCQVFSRRAGTGSGPALPPGPAEDQSHAG
ncbi:MAG: hypothetical protein RDU89_10980 [bacterium]|nr:hypothetical protein [bacterium]